MPLDLTKLRQNAKENLSFLGVLQAIARCQPRRNLMTAKVLITDLEHRRGARVDHEEVLSALRMLEGAGAGHVLDGGLKDRARMVWAVRPRSLVASILNPAVELVASDYLDPGARPIPAPSEPAVPAGWVRYRLPLRPEVEITLDLPADLTKQEASRLAHLLHAAAHHA